MAAIGAITIMAAVTAGCGTPIPRTTQASRPPATHDQAMATIRCPGKTKATWEGDVYGKIVRCVLPDGTSHGPAILYFGGSATGAYDQGTAVGIWRQWSSTGQFVGRYNLNAGTGIESRWYDDGSLEWQGSVEDGKRHGTWTYWRDGAVSMTQEWDHGRAVRTTGSHWISEIDEVDECPDTGQMAPADDGCPDTGSGL